MPPVPLFNLAPHKACDTVDVLVAHLTIHHREPEGSEIKHNSGLTGEMASLCTEHVHDRIKGQSWLQVLFQTAILKASSSLF